MHVEWASRRRVFCIFVFNSFVQPEAGLFIEQLTPPAALAAFISAPGQSK